jgi:hypothetical protein
MSEVTIVTELIVTEEMRARVELRKVRKEPIRECGEYDLGDISDAQCPQIFSGEYS